MQTSAGKCTLRRGEIYKAISLLAKTAESLHNAGAYNRYRIYSGDAEHVTPNAWIRDGSILGCSSSRSTLTENTLHPAARQRQWGRSDA